MLSKTRESSGILHSDRWRIGARSTVGGAYDSIQQLYVSYNNSMRASQDVIGVFPSYYWVSGTTCVLVQYITTSQVLLSTWYQVQRIIAACVVVMWSQSLYLSRMSSQRGRWALKRAIEPKGRLEITWGGILTSSGVVVLMLRFLWALHVCVLYKAIRSAGGFNRPLRSLREKILKKMGMNVADRAVHAFRWKVATWNCQELHRPRNYPRHRMCEI